MTNEGWGVVTGKKAHYYRDTFSLCRKRGFYTGPLDTDDTPTPNDCAQCRRKLDAEKRKRKSRVSQIDKQIEDYGH